MKTSKSGGVGARFAAAAGKGKGKGKYLLVNAKTKERIEAALSTPPAEDQRRVRVEPADPQRGFAVRCDFCSTTEYAQLRDVMAVREKHELHSVS